jgi:hypothetical protein
MISGTIQQRFLREFTLALLKTVKICKFCTIKQEVINADLVPHVAEKIIQEKMLGEKEIMPEFQESKKLPELPVIEFPKPAVKKPMPKAIFLPKSAMKKPAPVLKPASIIPKIEPPVTIPAPADYKMPESSFGKIDSLLRDPTITMIECSGAGQNISVIRIGQKQFTKISLNPLEIKNLLEKVAEKARVPLIEGVFRAEIENFSINAVISSVIGSRFVIKKQTPYSLLETQ